MAAGFYARKWLSLQTFRRRTSQNAEIPVWALPNTKAWISWVPS